MAGHHLVAADAGQDGVHDRPLGRGELPAVLGLGLRQLDDLAESGVVAKLATVDEDAAPDDPARLADTLDGAATETEVHRGLALARGPLEAADEVGRRCGTGDEEHPDIGVERLGEILAAGAGVVAAPTQIMERILGSEAELAPELVGDESVEAGALVHLVEVGKRFACTEFRAGLLVINGGTLNVVEESLDEVGGGGEVLKALLVLDADRGTAELCGDADGGDVHLALLEDLVLGEILFLTRAELEGHAAVEEPLVDLAGLVVLHGEHLRVEGRLAEALLEDTGLVDQLVGDDRVVHAHAALVEDTHDLLVVAELLRELGAELLGIGGDARLLVGLHVRGGVRDGSGGQPRAEALKEGLVAEVVAPEGTVLHACLGQGAVEIEHADEPRPGAAPVGDGQDRALVGEQTLQEMVAILPDRLGNDDWRILRDIAEDLHAVLLAVDETVAPLGVESVSAANFAAFFLDGLDQQSLHGLLGFLAFLVGRGAEIAVGDQDDLLGAHVGYRLLVMDDG